MPAPETLAALGSSPDGLTDAEAQRRLSETGPNRLPAPARVGPLRRFLLQFHNLLIYVLLGAAGVTAALGDLVDTLVILAVVLINAVIGFVQEGRAESALDAIRRMLSAEATVLRDGRAQTVPAESLVPGDIVRLQSGDRVPADLRLVAVKRLLVDEASLTGESLTVEKAVEPVAAAAALADRTSVAFSGTVVAQGTATGLVVATGVSTEIGRIGALLDTVGPMTTPLLAQVERFSRQLAALILVIAVLVFAIGFFGWGLDLEEMFSAAVGLAVAAIPEGLPAVMTIVLAIGVRRMAQRRAIVRRLPAVETLGAVSVICTDKTGTLTRNEMAVAAVATAGGIEEMSADGPVHASVPHEAAIGAALCNDARLGPEGAIEGDPMEGALLLYAARAGVDPDTIRREHPRADEIPFESDHKFMATLNCDGAGRATIWVKGAPEKILGFCAPGPGRGTLDHWHGAVTALARRGQRVLALARREATEDMRCLGFPDIEAGGFTLVALFGLMDPPRPEALAAVAECREAGLRVKMITGDHGLTARSIADMFGLGGGNRVLTGPDLDGLDRSAFATAANDVDVFARTTPEHKLRLVEALQQNGATVAMTGDGVNDAPALKRADIGVAMGKRGTEAAKDAAQIVLADDNFASIAHAVEEGRVVYDNLRKALLFLLGTNAAQALTITVAVVLGQHLPITAVQILWINMVSAVTLGLALAFEGAEPGLMRRPPRPKDQPLVGGPMWLRIAVFGAVAVAATFAIFEAELAQSGDLARARTAAVNALVGCEIVYLFAVRRGLAPLLAGGTFEGPQPGLIAAGLISLLQLLLTYWPPLQAVFGTAALGPTEWVRVVLTAAIVLVLVEIEKALLRRLNRPA
ncbi:MAG: HAD-IC family P-type ATPase [Geminicoccaceae bacterium]